MKIGKSDVLWNYGANFMRMASALIVLPLMLRLLPSEDIGLWSIMIDLITINYLLDFGFNNTFSRVTTYIFSGATSIQEEGYTVVEEDRPVYYPLLKGVIKAMKRFYSLIALLLLLLFLTLGSFYIETLLVAYSGDIFTAKLSWYLYGILLCYQFYTYYYDALLVGRGLIKRSKQIIVISQLLHLLTASTLLLSGYGIMSMVIGQTVATIFNRVLAHRVFYDKETVSGLKSSIAYDWRIIIKKLWVTAYKSGLSTLSWVLANRSLTLIGALYIPLYQMGSYGPSKQVVSLVYTISLVWFMTYYPKLTQYQLRDSIEKAKNIYLKAQIISFSIYILAAAGFLLFGDWVLTVIKSKTPWLDSDLMVLFFITSMLEAFTYISTAFLLSRNHVPYYRSQAITGVAVVLVLVLVLEFTDMDILAMIVVPFIVQIVYQHWKWTGVVFRLLDVKLSDYGKILKIK